MKLSIIIVSWNVISDLSNCLKSIEQYPPSSEFEIIVVDNNSSDDTVETVKSQFPDVIVIDSDKNLGFAAGNNKGLKIARGRHILLLNPDTIVHSASLDRLIMFMDNNPDVGACGPKLLNTDGSTQKSVRHFPSFRGVLHRYTIFKFLPIFKNAYQTWLMKDFSYDCQAEVCQLMGAALMIRKSVLDQVSLMDEAFFMYYEEVDLCYRIKQSGKRIVFLPEAKITHLGGQSSLQIRFRKKIIMITSLFIFFRKHRGHTSTFLFNCIFAPTAIIYEICNIITNSFNYVISMATFNKHKHKKSGAKIKTSFKLLCKYSRHLFRSS